MSIPCRKSSAHNSNQNHPQVKRRLLEHLAVSPGKLLATLDNGLVPRPLVLDELLVLGVLGVELGELVALVVGSDIESGESILAADKENTLDDGGVGLAKD
jgi:hypothetical protein